MHNFWTIEDSQAHQADMTGFLKNLSMIGGLLIFTWVLSQGGTAYTITDGIL